MPAKIIFCIAPSLKGAKKLFSTLYKCKLNVQLISTPFRGGTIEIIQYFLRIIFVKIF
jgi:hypothetical protein